MVTLEQNYRSTQPILDAANAVIALAGRSLRQAAVLAPRAAARRPQLATVADELAQVDFVVRRILERREAGVPLRQQAVLFRAAHHSDALEVELGRRNIPFVKFGGLRFLEAAHVKDALACLRWAENPRDTLAAFRVAQLLPGMGPRLADALVRHVTRLRAGPLPAALAGFGPPAAARADWPAFVALFAQLCDPAAAVGRADGPGAPLVPAASRADLRRRARAPRRPRTARAAGGRRPVARALPVRPDAGSAAGDRRRGGPPHLDEDYLILSTIHSAKGQEWDSVFVLNAADGWMPSDLATGHPAEIEEERRLLYVAMTRAKNTLALVHPLRFFVRQQSRFGDRHVFTPRTRFIPDAILDRFDRVTPEASGIPATVAPAAPRIDVAARLRASWAG